MSENGEKAMELTRSVEIPEPVREEIHKYAETGWSEEINVKLKVQRRIVSIPKIAFSRE